MTYIYKSALALKSFLARYSSQRSVRPSLFITRRIHTTHTPPSTMPAAAALSEEFIHHSATKRSSVVDPSSLSPYYNTGKGKIYHNLYTMLTNL